MIRRNEMELKMRNLEKLSKVLDVDIEKAKSQQETIRKNLDSVDVVVNQIKSDVNWIDKTSTRENEHKTKSIVKLKIIVENISREFEFFRKEFGIKSEQLTKNLKNSDEIKIMLESNFKTLANKITDKILSLNSEVIKLKSGQETIKAPLTEYCDLLTNEIANITDK